METKLNFNILPLFSIPIVECTLDANDNVIEYINSLQYKRTNLSNSYISLSKNVLDNDIMYLYSKHIDDYIKKFLFEVMEYDQKFVTAERVSSWANKHLPGDWAQSHSHDNSFVSGVWYLETSNNCGDLEVQIPYAFSGIPINFEKSKNNQFNSRDCTLPAIRNKVYIFPSTLTHNVRINKSNKVRTSIAFNYYIRGQLISESNLFYS